jgi:hypothetical protein
LAAVFTVGPAGCESFSYLTRVTEEFPRAKQCGKCHVEIFQEWSRSDHATAYVNPHFSQATDDYAFEDCLSCHVPQPNVSDKPPIARWVHRTEGVTCVSCHLEQGKLSGPIEPTGKIAPHPIGVKPEFYNNSIICGHCHEGTFAEWKSAADREKKPCQHCHMSPVKRKVTQATGGFSNVIVSFEKEVAQKRHDFAILATGSVEQPASFEAQRSGSDVVLVLRNNLPHSLPTGDFGFRVLLLKIFTVSPQGNVVSLGQREFAKELGNAIPPEGTARWQLEAPPETRAIQVRMVRQSYEEDQALDLMDVEIPVK